jgi:hypothetical protein
LHRVKYIKVGDWIEFFSILCRQMALVFAILGIPSAFAAYPVRPFKVLVPFALGGLAEQLEQFPGPILLIWGA